MQRLETQDSRKVCSRPLTFKRQLSRGLPRGQGETGVGAAGAPGRRSWGPRGREGRGLRRRSGFAPREAGWEGLAAAGKGAKRRRGAEGAEGRGAHPGRLQEQERHLAAGGRKADGAAAAAALGAPPAPRPLRPAGGREGS